MIRNRTSTAALIVAALLLAACDGGSEPPRKTWRGMTYDEVEPAEDFTLTDQYGKPFRLSDYRGKLVLLFFGYVHCPDVCPVTLSTWAKVQRAFENERDRLEFVFVTVDPDRDTVERLRQHLEIFSQDFVGLTGTEEELTPVYDAYGIFQEKIPFSTSAGGYVVDHSTRILVIDAQGKLRLRFPFDSDPDDIVHDVRRLLEE